MAKSVRLSSAVLLLVMLAASWPLTVEAAKRKSTSKKSPAAAAGPVKPSPPAPEEELLPPGMKLAVPDIPPDLAELPLAAKGAIALDEFTGQVVYEKNADEPQFPASTTKIMTALLVIEEGSLDHEVEVTLEDSKVGESSLEIKPGDRFTRLDGLYGLMLKSANDVAHALGRDNAGSIEAFAEKMNRRARELGATHTHFANPNGLHDPQHYTSPRDLALIARAAMQQPLFRQIVGTQFHGWSIASTGPRELRNHNRLLWAFPGCCGVKTGYTYPAQQVLVSAAQWGCRECIAVIMHSNKPGIWDDSRMLLTWGLEGRTEPAAAPLQTETAVK